MVEMAKLTLDWTGFTGAPGYTNLYFRDFSQGGDIDQGIVDGAITKTDTWINAWNPFLPSTVNVKINPQVEIIEDTTGQLVRFMTGAPFQRANGSGTGNYSAATGAVVNWYTTHVVRGRRLRGRSFLVPFSSSALNATGQIASGNAATLRTATNTFVSQTGAGDIGVWSRPSTPGGSDGIWALASSATVPEKVAVLRSRRD